MSLTKKICVVAIVLLIFLAFLTGCAQRDEPELPVPNQPDSLEEEQQATSDIENAIKMLESQVDELKSQNTLLHSEISALQEEITNLTATQPASLLSTALAVVEILKNEDMLALSAVAHPALGVRFSAYPYVDLTNDLVFTSAQISNLMLDTQIYTWGSFDGTGDPIQKTFSDYFDRFVYSNDFANPHLIGNNVAIGTGNTINNISQAYPNGSFIEFHFTGFDPQYGGMDWRSLRLVFENFNNTWYLVAIVHGEWTI